MGNANAKKMRCPFFSGGQRVTGLGTESKKLVLTKP
jgi:hypothetical protein